LPHKLARKEAWEGRDERRRCNERQRRRQTGGGGMLRGNRTTSQSGQQDGRNKGAQQEAKAWRESEAPADGRHWRDSPVLRLCFNTKGKKGGSGRMPTARNCFGRLKYKWLNKERYPSLWGILLSVFGQHFGLSIGEAFEQDKMQSVWYFNSVFFWWVLMDSGL
jgi:hypothetical protein